MKTWLKTVLSNGALLELLGTPNFTEREGREKQAEITWKEAYKAGYDKGQKDKIPNDYFDTAYSDGEKSGVKEVVELINRLAIFTVETAKDGEKYTYLGSYILRWGKEAIPSYGFKPLDECAEWQDFKQKKGIK